MGINFKSTIDFQRIAKELIEKKKVILARALEEEAGDIVQRTTGGKEIEGASFKPYSPGYKRRRAVEGESTTPNLTKTGQMLGSITSDVKVEGDKIKGRIYLTGFNAKKAEWNQKLRPFFGLSKKQVKNLIEQLKK